MNTPRNDFRRTRRLRSRHLKLQILLSLSLILAINYLASRNYARYDLTTTGQHSLSPETEGYLRNLKGDINIYVTIPESAGEAELRRLREDVRRLLRKMAFVVNQDAPEATLTVEFVDLFKERTRARELQASLGINRPNAIVVECGDAIREIAPDTLYDFNEGRITGFLGESVFLSAILDVVYGQDGKLYLVVGQGEMRYDSVKPDRGLSQAYDFLRTYGVLIDQIDLTAVDTVPADARALLIASPSTSYRSREAEMLRDFLASGGSVVAFLDPGVESGLAPVLRDWGIDLPDMVVIDTGPDFRSASGSLLIRRFSNHPITELLIKLQVTLLTGLPRPVIPDFTEAIRSQGIRLESILGTSANSFGEASYRDSGPPGLNPDVDLPGPVSIGVAAERSLSNEVGVSLGTDRSSRLLVVGNSDLIANSNFQAVGNHIFLRNAVNWAMERNDMLRLNPRPVNEYLLVVSKEELFRLGGLFLIVPAVFLFTAGLAQIARN